MLFEKIRKTLSLPQFFRRRWATSLHAEFDVAHTRIDSSGLSLCIICKIASINVLVLPVPGGPNSKYGYGYDVCFKILITADFCSSLISLELHSILKIQNRFFNKLIFFNHNKLEMSSFNFQMKFYLRSISRI